MDLHLAVLLLLLCLCIAYEVLVLLLMLRQVDEVMVTEPHPDMSNTWPMVTVALPMHNQGACVSDSLQALQAIDYPHLEVLVVNDGSTDHSVEHLCQAHQIDMTPSHSVWSEDGQTLMNVHRSSQQPRLFLYDMPRSGQVSALNTALRFARGQYFLALSPGCMPGQQALKRLVLTLENQTNHLGATGAVRLRNGGTIKGGVLHHIGLVRSVLLPLQILGSLRAIVLASVRSMVWNDGQGTGLLTLLRTRGLRQLGGFAQQGAGDSGSVSLDLSRPIAGLHHQKLTAVPHAHFWVSAPQSWRAWYQQQESGQRAHSTGTRQLKLFALGLAMTALLCAPLQAGQAVSVLGTALALLMAVNMVALLNETLRPGPPARPTEVLTLVLCAVIEPLVFRPLNLLALLAATFRSPSSKA